MTKQKTTFTLLFSLALLVCLPMVRADAQNASKVQPTTPDMVAGERPSGRRGISIVEGSSQGNQKTFSVQADSADIGDLLKSLFAKTGDEFAIDQDVTGLVDLRIKEATLDEICRRIAEVSRPRLNIRREKTVYRVSLAADPQRTAQEIQNRMAGGTRFPNGTTPRLSTPGGGLQAVPLGGDVLANPALAERYVTLDIPKERPITLLEAVNRIAQQTQTQIVLDRRIPRDMEFYGHITRASLPLVLYYFTKDYDFKLVPNGSQIILAPSDQFILKLRNIELGRYPGKALPQNPARPH